MSIFEEIIKICNILLPIFFRKMKVEKLLILTYMCIVYNVQLVFSLKSVRRVTFKLGSDSKSMGRTELHLEIPRNLPQWRPSHHHHVVSSPNHCSMLLFLWLSLKWSCWLEFCMEWKLFAFKHETNVWQERLKLAEANRSWDQLRDQQPPIICHLSPSLVQFIDSSDKQYRLPYLNCYF